MCLVAGWRAFRWGRIVKWMLPPAAGVGSLQVSEVQPRSFAERPATSEITAIPVSSPDRPIGSTGTCTRIIPPDPGASNRTADRAPTTSENIAYPRAPCRIGPGDGLHAAEGGHPLQHIPNIRPLFWIGIPEPFCVRSSGRRMGQPKVTASAGAAARRAEGGVIEGYTASNVGCGTYLGYFRSCPSSCAVECRTSN